MDVMKSARAIASLISLAALPALADPVLGPRFVEIGHSIDSFGAAAAGRFAHADVDGDGIQDLVFTGYAYGSILFVVGKKADTTIGFKQADVVGGGSSVARVLSWQPNGVPHILVVGASGTVRDYSGWPLLSQRQFAVASGAVAAAVGDINADGISELLVLTPTLLNVYGLDDGLLRWSEPALNNQDLAVAQLDADPALEIILAGGVPGRVVDGATRAVDWDYIDGFGSKIATGRLAAGGGTQWVGYTSWANYTVFRATPWSPLWTGLTSHDIGALATADIDNNDRDVILQGDGQWGGLHVIDSTTRLERFVIPSSGYGSNAAIAADIDGDGRKEIAFTSAGNSPRDPILVIADSVSAAVKWSYYPTDGPFIASAIADVNGDGRAEVIAATRMTSSNGAIAIFDILSGSQIWRSPSFIGNANDPFYISVKQIAFRDRVAGPGKDIVLAGNSIYSGRIIVVDGVTRQVRLQIGYYSNGPMESEGIKGLQLYDYNHDGVEDFIVATDAQTTGSQGARLRVFSGTDGTQLWTSVTMGSGFAQINNVLLADPPSGTSGKELVAVMPGSLRSYSSETGLLNWTLAVTNSNAIYIPNGVAGAEFAVYDDSRVRFYSAADRSFLRETSVPTPLRALTALNGDVGQLVAAAAGKLMLVDGSTGQVRTETPYLGAMTVSGMVSSAADGDSASLIAYGNESAFYRYRIEFTDRIYAAGFESQ